MKALLVAGLLFLPALPVRAELAEIVHQAVQFLTRTDARQESTNALRHYAGEIAPVLEALAARERKNHEPITGRLFDQRFSEPGLREQYNDDILNYLIPNGYSPDQPFGLLIFMHGGGPGTQRKYAEVVLTDPAKFRSSYGLAPHFTNSRFIVVAPSAPWNEKSSARWNLPEADAYIDAVIRESCFRFNIDRNRVFLGGQSMGGFGAYHLCQRLAYRIAGGVLYAGAWASARWENMLGTPLFIRHGVHDAKPPNADGKGGRPRFTDVYYARSASQLLTAAGVDHVYFEDDGDHSIRAAEASLKQLVEWMEKQRRNPYASRVIAQTPRGWNGSRDQPAPHHRWITIHETAGGTLPFDEVRRTGPGPQWKEPKAAFERQGFKLRQRRFTAAKVDATNLGDNHFAIRTRNVRDFSIWLHPEMADLSKPIRLTVNGRTSQLRAKASLHAALRSYQRSKDWKSIYWAELRISEVPSEQLPAFPQWRGPNRDGHFDGFAIPKTWPKELTKDWSIPVGTGYSCPITDGTNVFLHYRVNEDEEVICADLASGEIRWRTSYPAKGQVHPAGAAHGIGPKSTPVVCDGRLFTLGISSILSCFEASTGRLLWRKDYADEFPRPAPSCGTSMSPLIADGKCIVHVGVDREGRLIAADTATGKELWSYNDDGPGYGSPVTARLHGERQLVTPVSKFITGISLRDGQRLWRHPFPTQSRQNILTPVVHRDRLIVGGIAQVTASIRPGESIQTVWRSRDVPMHMSSPVLKGNRLYGMSSRNAGHLFCIDAESGQTIWQSEGRVAKNATVLHLGSHLIWLTGDGKLIFTRADADKYDPVAAYQVSDNRTWAYPLPIGNRLIIKDEKNLTCWLTKSY